MFQGACISPKSVKYRSTPYVKGPLHTAQLARTATHTGVLHASARSVSRTVAACLRAAGGREPRRPLLDVTDMAHSDQSLDSWRTCAHVVDSPAPNMCSTYFGGFADKIDHIFITIAVQTKSIKLIGFGTGGCPPIDCRLDFCLYRNSYPGMRLPTLPLFTNVVHILGARVY